MSHSWRDERKPTVDRGMVVGFNVGSDARGTDSQQRYAPEDCRWIPCWLVEEGKKEKRRQVERKLVPFSLSWRRTAI